MFFFFFFTVFQKIQSKIVPMRSAMCEIVPLLFSKTKKNKKKQKKIKLTNKFRRKHNMKRWKIFCSQKTKKFFFRRLGWGTWYYTSSSCPLGNVTILNCYFFFLSLFKMVTAKIVPMRSTRSAISGMVPYFSKKEKKEKEKKKKKNKQV